MRYAVLVCATRETPAEKAADPDAVASLRRARGKAVLDALSMLDAENGIAIILHGDTVEDRWGQRWAEPYRSSVRVAAFPVLPEEWAQSKSAGHCRNRRMASELSRLAGVGLAPVVVASWDGQSKGTAGMLELTRFARQIVLEAP